MVAGYDAKINNHDGATFSFVGINAGLMVAGHDAELNNYNGGTFNLLGVNGNLLVAHDNATINNYNGGTINMIGLNNITLVATNGTASVNNYDGGRINMVGINSVFLSGSEVNNSSNNDFSNVNCLDDPSVAGICVTKIGVWSGIAGSQLEFNNSGGLVSMINGSSTTLFDATGAVVPTFGTLLGDLTIINGNFNASGNSQLGIDARLGGPGADFLIGPAGDHQPQ